MITLTYRPSFAIVSFSEELKLCKNCAEISKYCFCNERVERYTRQAFYIL